MAIRPRTNVLPAAAAADSDADAVCQQQQKFNFRFIFCQFEIPWLFIVALLLSHSVSSMSWLNSYSSQCSTCNKARYAFRVAHQMPNAKQLSETQSLDLNLCWSCLLRQRTQSVQFSWFAARIEVSGD